MSEQHLSGRRAVVTGGAGGIGAACVRALAARGADVVVADRDGDAARVVAEEVGGEAWVVDLSDTAALEDLRLQADILVNNAGIQVVSPIEDFAPDDFRRIQRIMVEAPFLLIRAALPHMYDGGWGRVVNISSVHGLVASPYKSAYVTAKHALEGLSKVTALEGAARGVTSVCVNPGYVRTALVERQITDQARAHGISEDEVLEKVLLTQQSVKRLVEPDEVGSLVAWLTGPDSGMATGSSYVLDGGWHAR
ncbi:3-hydroxybutyrate dehydrogenase [Georgenia sp. H159]|uniref:3-hydroxybutyrate dehydrogenase n=1 Tax=Georgenia sp. H159 TaxID=3076115 RepID=UPI002D784B37|nr:3-hydroxybutyrate dehydrogenase [Georgenia sp. H159]